MRVLRLIAIAISMLAAANAAQAQGYWLDYCCTSPDGVYYAAAVPVYESWPKEAYYAPIGPMPWYGSMTVAEQSRMLAARAAAEAERERNAEIGQASTQQ
jgi:hypothetical protein